MKKVLTILVPVYNTEKYIKRCLDSILLKDVEKDIEVIVVSDGSKDHSVDIVKEYVDKFPDTLVLVEKENGGHGSTINKGLELATGKYFRVLDSDDWFNSLDFKEYVKRLSKEDADLVITNYRQEHIYSGESIKYTYEKLADDEMYTFDKFNIDDLKGEYFVMATSTYKTEVLRNSGLKMLEKTFYVDMQYNVVGFSKVKTFKYYDLDIYRYFIGRKDQSMNLNSFVNHKMDHEKVMKFLIEYYTNNLSSFSENLKKYYSIIIKYMLYTHYNIFCLYDKNHKEAYMLIKEFDKYLKNKSMELYQISNFGLIKYNRKTNFVFTRINGKFFNKIINFIKLFRRR